MTDKHFKSQQNQFLNLDTEKILSAPLYILLDKNVMDRHGSRRFRMKVIVVTLASDQVKKLYNENNQCIK